MEIRATTYLRNNKMLAARERLCLSQRSLAELANVPYGTILRLEKLDYSYRRKIPTEHVLRLSALLGLTAEEIAPEQLHGKVIPSRFSTTRKVDVERLLDAATRQQRFIQASPEELLEREELKAQLRKAMKTLSFRERSILELRFGLSGEKPLTLEEVGRRYRVSKDRARQLEAKALRLLHHPARARYIEAYVDD